MEAIKPQYDLNFYQERRQRLNYWVDYKQLINKQARKSNTEESKTEEIQVINEVPIAPEKLSWMVQFGLIVCWLITTVVFASMAFVKAGILPLLGILTLWMSLSITRTVDQQKKQFKKISK